MILAADVTVTLPWPIWTSAGTVLVGAFGWLARLTIKALNDSRASDEKRHQEVVELTREVASSLSDNTGALREMAKSLDNLATYVLKEKNDA